ncbi:MAG: SDR family oxidoreductase [Candidatus Vecturithrix sp.]|jgi:gluconate 5-dehydrogenase|nr:SDR family oxidoreductase [Candidatus Vecturithrix sp.]
MTTPPLTLSQAFDLSGELVLITGGGTGLGFSMAQCMIAAGARVIITGRRESVLQEAVSQLGTSAAYRVQDVTDFQAAPQLIAKIEAHEGKITTLINNAGQHVKALIEDTQAEDFERLYQVHVTGAIELSKAVIPGMKAREQGNILFITSMASLFGVPQVTAYSAAKTALLGVVRTMAAELSPDGIRVNTIAPGWIQTDIFTNTVENDPERKQKILARTPLRDFGQGRDVGWAAVYLCSPAARFITGVCLPVDGGVSIGF